MTQPSPIYLFTDYGYQGPYVGLLRAAIARTGYRGEVVDLQHDAPPFRPQAAGLLLNALLPYLPDDAVVVAVVDPGVGSEREGLVLRHGQRALVGPDNGLLAPLFAGATGLSRIAWRPQQMSLSFHGRDWFAPVGARLAMGEDVELAPLDPVACENFDHARYARTIIYADQFGNLMTGIAAAELSPSAHLQLGDQELTHARVFSAVPPGTAFWYANSLGLVEIAVNQGSAQGELAAQVGDWVTVLE